MKQNNNFFFLISSERSGSNLITNLLNNHKNICAPSPTHLFRLFANNSHKFGKGNFRLDEKKLVKYFYLAFKNKFTNWDLNISKNELSKLSVDNAIDYVKYVYQKLAFKQKKKIIFVKENYTYSFSKSILSNIQNVKFVYLVRDPRSVAASWLNRNEYGGAEEAVKIWINDQKETIKFLYQLKKGNFYLIKYEDILKKNLVFKKLFKFINVKYDPKILNFYKKKETIQLSKLTNEWKNLSKPLMKNNDQIYRKILNKDEINYVEKQCKDLMVFFGYRISNNNNIYVKKNIRKFGKKILTKEKEKREKRLKIITDIKNLNYF